MKANIAEQLKTGFPKVAGLLSRRDPYADFLAMVGAAFDVADEMKKAGTAQHLQILVRDSDPGQTAHYKPVRNREEARELISHLPQTCVLSFWVKLSGCQNDGPVFAATAKPYGVLVATHAQWLRYETSFVASCRPSALVERLRSALLEHSGLTYEDAARIKTMPAITPRPL
ncbi:MAG: hypothetical protein HYS17_00220 [Micavibrio aeruginosavorus]|uniref:Uncharacterized protein n=1 Tax=Micavibrio aeruginosavorus TaxID=349221 RepID=A0A7T5R2D8_9BACT|nr:MAG: hypothetical protein HYS17_00220 [Micavibrio aeruginosavorus]